MDVNKSEEIDYTEFISAFLNNYANSNEKYL